ncbi:hypothetical protein [Celeribacter sp.]|uniref:hypothetical protein n=1 Tax=Celeribacter sp. TaxID=1890673 RepID=UPI003A959C30
MQVKQPKWQMRLAIAIWAATSIYFSVFNAVLAELGPWAGLGMLIAAVFFAALVGPAFEPLYAQGPLKQILASLTIMMVSAGTTIALSLLPAILIGDEPLASIVTLPVLFTSGALLAPYSVITHPISIMVWVAGTLAIGRIAKWRATQHTTPSIHEPRDEPLDYVSDYG